MRQHHKRPSEIDGIKGGDGMVVLYGWGDWVNLLQAMDKCIEQDWMFTNVNMEGSDAQWLAAWIWSSLTLASVRAVVAT